MLVADKDRHSRAVESLPSDVDGCITNMKSCKPGKKWAKHCKDQQNTPTKARLANENGVGLGFESLRLFVVSTLFLSHVKFVCVQQ
jgi:hypothetical protein